MKRRKTTNIYIGLFKECKLPKVDGYIPLYLGKNGKKDLNIMGDDTGKNISSKNENYCELTGLYWINKNVECDFVGLVHYRRFFFEKIYQHSLNKIIDKNKIEEILENYDIIVPKKYYVLDKSNYDNYKKLEHIKDLEMCRNVISEKYPDYLTAFDKSMKKRYFYPFNMFITTKKLFNEYTEWLFGILFEVEKRVDISNYNQYDKRIFGFLSERLFDVWLEKENLNKKELFVYNIEVNYFKQIIINIIKRILIK